MFAAHALPSTPSTPFKRTAHYPARPSPLGTRSSNITTPPWTMGSRTCDAQSTPKPNNQTPQQQSPTLFEERTTTLLGGKTTTTPFQFSPHNQSSALMSPTSPSPTAQLRYANRYTTQIANPLKTTTSLARSKTRKTFLDRVKSDRDAGRFQARGEQIMMMEHLAEKQRWEEEMAREVDGVIGEDQIEDEMIPDEGDVSALDEFVSQEEAMEKAFLETISPQQNGRMEPDVAFSDDEYEDIFNNLSNPTHSSQEMDMS